MKKLLLFICMIVFSVNLQAQWTIQPAVGIALPLSGYSSIVGAGPMFQIDFYKRLSESKWGLGFMMGWARLHNDDNSGDVFTNARLDQVPFCFTLDYELGENHFKPYLGLGIGLSYYNLTFDKTYSTAEVDDNVSFSLMPRAGLRYEVNQRLFPFIEANAPLVMDGSPKGSDFSNKTTGYFGLCVGLAYRFIK